MCANVFACVCICMFVDMCILNIYICKLLYNVCEHVYACMGVDIHVYIHICVCPYVFACVCMHVYLSLILLL